MATSVFVRANGEVDIVAQGPNNSLRYYWATPGSAWSRTEVAPPATTFSAPSVFVRANGEADIVAQGPNNSLWYYWATPGSAWSRSRISSGPHARCGWLEDTVGVTSFQRNTPFFDVIHPIFYMVDNPPTFNLTATPMASNINISPAAQAAGTDVWPLIKGPTDTGAFGQMLNNQSLRTQHVTALVNELQAPLLVPGNPVYAGFDINYEGLDNQYHQGFWDFLTELTNRAHALGKQISVTVGAFDTDAITRSDYPINPYMYEKLLTIVDFIHIECYDFHFPGSCDPMHIINNHDHIGPTAPRGWVADALQVVMNTGSAQKFIYGMPNYGRTAKAKSGDPDPTAGHLSCDLAWDYATLNQLSQRCDSSTLKFTTDHMSHSCFTDSTSPCCWRLNPGQFFDAGRQLNCHQATDPSTTIFFDDLDSLEERLKLAHDQGLGGMAYYTVGDELPGFFDRVGGYF